jgi:DNA polymerase-3 subunit chi
MEIGFYHLQRAGLDQALPKVLEKVVERGLRAVVLAPTDERIESLNAQLWTYGDRTFLPHGAAADGFAEDQPIYLTTTEENPNGATVLVLVDGADPAYLGDFERCLDMFDGRDDEAVAAARARWSARKDAGHEVAYWQQKPEGGWEQKA